LGAPERNRRGAAAERERVEQKDQKIGKYEEDGSEQVIGAAAPSILIFPIFLFAHPLPVAGLAARGA
jgi:hypothetical protein